MDNKRRRSIKVPVHNGRPPDMTFDEDNERRPPDCVNIADRKHDAEGIERAWTAIEVDNCATVLLILDAAPMVYGQHPSAKPWSLELPAGCLDANDMVRQAAIIGLYGRQVTGRATSSFHAEHTLHAVHCKTEGRRLHDDNLAEGKRNLKHE